MTQEANPGEIILINKPLGWTSFQAVKKVKYIIKAKKIGHAGTLDPLASGLLVLCTEKSTKKIEGIQAAEKEYTGTITLGNTTPSYDLETEFNGQFAFEHLTDAEIHAKTAAFTGKIMQIPPVFSAIKVDGKRSYALARKGVAKELKAREVLISEFEITKIQLPDIDFRVVCSKGTYIRTLAHDFAIALGSGGHLSKLVRTRIGDFKLENASTPAELEAKRKVLTEPTSEVEKTSS